MASPHFSPGLFQFLRELAANNDRRWFEANRERYEADVREPMLRFIGDFGKHLRTISPNFRADPRPVGGSMFRIHRDVRFSKDKSPYKTGVAARFPHSRAGKDESTPGFYVHLEPGDCVGGGGLWHPDSPALKKVRDRIVAQPRDWKIVRAAGIPIEGDSLRRVPAAYNPSHPFAADLKMKDLYTMTRFTEKEVYAFDFLDRFVDACRSAAPLMKFLTRAVGLPW